jgi:LPS export ABC transporter protein LptC
VIEDNILLKSLNIDDFIQTIEAAFIELNLETKAVQSDSLIELKGAEFSMLSNGLVGNLANKQFSLVDHVKTEFFVDQSKD